MGRQTQFHVLDDDCRQLLGFLCERDPVVILPRDSSKNELIEVPHPCKVGGLYCLWNQALLPELKRKYVPESDRGPYFTVDLSLPVIELSYPSPEQELWNGRRVVIQGRIWASFEVPNKRFDTWYNAAVRWIRKNFIRNPVPLLGGYVGPAAHQFYKEGGVLLPIFKPPLTKAWLSWLAAQDQHRTTFST